MSLSKKRQEQILSAISNGIGEYEKSLGFSENIRPDLWDEYDKAKYDALTEVNMEIKKAVLAVFESWEKILTKRREK